MALIEVDFEVAKAFHDAGGDLWGCYRSLAVFYSQGLYAIPAGRELKPRRNHALFIRDSDPHPANPVTGGLTPEGGTWTIRYPGEGPPEEARTNS